MQQVSDALKAELVSKLVNHDLSVYEVAAQYHINPPTVYLWLREQGQLYHEAQRLTPEFLNLSGKAYYVVDHLETAAPAAAAAPAPEAANVAQAEAPAATAPDATATAPVEPSTAAVAESSSPAVHDAVASAASETVVSQATVAAAQDAVASAALEAVVAEDTAAATVTPESTDSSTPVSAPAEAVTPAATMAFPTPETKISVLEDLSSKLGVAALTASERAAEQEAQAAVRAAQAQVAQAQATEVKMPTTQELAQAIVPQPLRGKPVPEEDEAEVVDDCTTDNWGDVGNLDDMELELPASTAAAPKAQAEEDEASEEDDDELTEEEKDELLSRIERHEVTVNFISDAYDIPQFIIYQWLKERELKRAHAQAEEEAKEREAQEAAAAAEAAARKEARAKASGADLVVKERDGRGMKVSGDRKIRIIALATTGLMSNAMLAESFHVSVSFVSVLLREVREEGLLPWCLSLRNLDKDYLGAADLIAREQKEKQPEVAFAQISAFKLAAVDAVLNRGLSVNKTATIFGLSGATLNYWIKKAKEQGLEAWAKGAGISEEDFVWLTPCD